MSRGGFKMKLIHIYHSGVLVKIQDSILIFDCLDSNISKSFSEEEKIYTFVSHGHSDHYSRSIFQWDKINPKIKYILSSDIKIYDKKQNYHFMDEYQEINIDDLKIQSFGSTDIGVSFLVTIKDKKIFHAGDLNWWHWKNDSSEAQKKEEEDFKYEVEKLRGENIDIAFIPVDPRLKEHYYLAAEYFAKTIGPKLLVPIHFGNDFDITKKINDKLSSYEAKVLEIERKNQEFDII